MQNVELIQDEFTDGTSLAYGEPIEAAAQTPPVNLDHLLHLFPKRVANRGPAIHSAAAKFLEYINSTPGETPIHLLETKQQRFVDYLKERHHSSQTVRSYRYCINLLLKAAREHGWQTPPKVMPPEWATVLALVQGKPMRSIVEYAVEIGKLPSTFTEDDLGAWRETRVKAGRTFGSCRRDMSIFRTLMSRPELAHLQPRVRASLPGYGTPLRNMHDAVRKETEDLMLYLTDELEFDRPGPPIRIATAKTLLATLERLVGFVENIQNEPQVESLLTILTKSVVTEYIKWAMRERSVLGETLFRELSGIRSCFDRHSKYPDLDLSWLVGVLKKLPRAKRSEIDRRKQKKYISFDAAECIPTKIRADRARAKKQTQVDLALSLRNELLMLWLVILPWRQRNLRECRIVGGNHPNLFKEPIPRKSSATQPGWLIEQEKSCPGKPVWQIYFSSNETKSKNEVAAFLPHDLVKVLEEYLEHRAALISSGGPDPGTLFVNDKGHAMTQAGIRSLVMSLSSKYAGTPTHPHLFRDIVAYDWLNHHPEDYLTVSKLLWHKSMEFTLKVYGSRFNESTGIARMDNWRNARRSVA